jgi:hypothetical protein
MSNDQGNDQSDNRWAIMLGAIGLLAIALLLLPPFPPWLRVVAVMLVVLAVLGGLGIFPRLRATWRRSLSDLPSDDQRSARWKRAFGLIGVLIVALLLLPPLPPRFRIIAVALAVFAVLGVLGILPGLRTRWRRWLSGLIIMFGVILVLLAFGPFPPPGFWRDGDGKAGVLRPGWVWSRPIRSWIPDWLIPTTTGTVRHFTLVPNGELDGLILDDGCAITDVATGGMVIDFGPPPRGFDPPGLRVASMQRISADGRLEMWLHGPAGKTAPCSRTERSCDSLRRWRISWRDISSQVNGCGRTDGNRNGLRHGRRCSNVRDNRGFSDGVRAATGKQHRANRFAIGR